MCGVYPYSHCRRLPPIPKPAAVLTKSVGNFKTSYTLVWIVSFHPRKPSLGIVAMATMIPMFCFLFCIFFVNDLRYASNCRMTCFVTWRAKFSAPFSSTPFRFICACYIRNFLGFTSLSDNRTSVKVFLCLSNKLLDNATLCGRIFQIRPSTTVNTPPPPVHLM
jgi:hypothetical protein